MKKIDFYHKPINLKIGEHRNMRTLIGAISSIITVILLLVYLFLKIEEITGKTTLKMVREESVLKDKNHFHHISNQTMIYFQIFDKDGSPFHDNTYFKIKIFFDEIRNYILVNQTEIDYEICNKENLFLEQKETKKKLIEEKYFCPNSKNLTNYKFHGAWADAEKDYLSIEIQPCNNSTDGVICKKKEEIEQKIWGERLNFNLFYPKMFINNSNFDNPYNQLYAEDSYYIGDTLSETLVYYNFKDTCILTDNGLFSENFYSRCEDEVIYKSSDFRSLKEKIIFFKMNFISSINRKNIYRSYLNFSELVTSIGGLFHSIQTIFGIITWYVSRFEKTILFLDLFYKYKGPDNKEIDEYNKNKKFYDNEIKNIFPNKNRSENPYVKNSEENTKRKRAEGFSSSINKEIKINEINDNNKDLLNPRVENEFGTKENDVILSEKNLIDIDIDETKKRRYVYTTKEYLIKKMEKEQINSETSDRKEKENQIVEEKEKEKENQVIEEKRKFTNNYFLELFKSKKNSDLFKVNYFCYLRFILLKCKWCFQPKNKNSFQYKMKELILSYIEKTEKYFDILVYAHLLLEFNMLKSMLLTKDQKFIMKIMSNKIVDINIFSDDKKVLMRSERENFKTIEGNPNLNLYEFFNRYEKSDENNFCNKIDKNLLNEIINKNHFEI